MVNNKEKRVNVLYKTCFFIFLSFLCSCKKFISIDPPVNQIVSSEVFSNDETATSAVIGLYNQMSANTLVLLNGGMTLYAGLSADEIYNTSFNADLSPFTSNSISPQNSTGLSYRLWSSSYNNIYQANAIIEGLTNNTQITESVQRQLLGESKFVRALYYFYLVNIFGDVPLITGTDYTKNAGIARTSAKEIYEQIITDLKEAQTLLPSEYATSGRARPNLWTVTALLARVYLFQKDWNGAEEQSSAIINSGMYNLMTDLNAVFTIESNETIWQLAPVSSLINTAEGNNFIPYSSMIKPGFALTNFLLNAFEPGDMRKNTWIDSTIINGEIYYYPYKYKGSNSNSVTEYYTVFRLAEQYLIRAEARNQQDKYSLAQEDLNIIRTRANLSNTPANTKNDLFNAIEKERRVELLVEWGHRWLDLKRWERIDGVLGAEKSGWKSTAALFPIPYNEIQRNPKLTQNPGY